MAINKALPITGNSVYLDVNSQFGINSFPELVADINAINNSLNNLLTCPIGQRPFLREYGCSVPYLLFEPVDARTAEQIKQSILQAITRWEPRIRLDYRNTRVEKLSDGLGYVVEMSYTIIGVNVTGRLAFNLSRL